MIGYFPTPYKDEFIYSILARYHQISSNKSEHITANELFTISMREINMDLFPYAKKLENRLKHFDFCNAVEIIEKYSFFNYYYKFLSYAPNNRFQSLMLEERSGWIGNELYRHDISQYNDKYYKFCLDCFEEDLKIDLPYWRISHNLPGVTYCNRHNCKLVRSDVKFNGKKFVVLSNEVKISDIPLLSDYEEELLKLITEETNYIFNCKENISEYVTPYISYLYDLGYIEDYTINEKKLKEHFMYFYSDNICKVLNINKDYVISHVIKKIKSVSKEIPPLFQILFLIFCNKKIKDLKENNPISTPFNKVVLKNCCNCFNGIFIHNCSLRFRGKVLWGKYKCSICEKIYETDAKDKNLSVRYGVKFSEQVMELLFIEDLSVSEICSKLHISKTELKNYLITRNR